MKKKTASRILAFMLTVVMVFGLVPVSVFAEETETQNTTPETVTVTFDVNGGIGEYEVQEVVVGGTITKPEADPIHETSMFAYWTADLEENEEWNFEENAVAGAMTLYATWIVSVEETEPEETEPEETEPEETEPEETKSVEAAYTVQHYLETAEGYVLDETATETKSGVVGEATVAEAKTYEGYTAQPFEQGTIAADGSTVVEIMYSADPVTVDATLGGGLESIGMTVITDKESTLAPGVTLNEIVMYDVNGDRVEMYLTTSDTSVDTVKFYANYKDNQCATWGMQTLSEQVAAMEANYEEPFKVVAGINASYYNTTTGAPTGAFVMEGVDASTSGDNYAFFAVLKDGTVMIGAKGEYSTYKDQIKEAIGGYVHIVKDGAVVSGLDKTTKYPRQTIGITADGKVITMTADGSQAPQTVGLTIQEQAEVMLALGCVEALHLDGGNSATFGTVPEGSDTFVTTNSPSGGAERAVSNTLMIVSTAVADGTFDHAVITSDYDYLVPYSTYTFGAFGVDATNASAEIPETAVWTLSDDSFGTIENGTFVSNGTLGSVDIQLSNDGKVIGSKTINVVTPTALSFPVAETTVPYGKTAELIVSAMYGNNEAFCTADAFNFTVDPDAAGTMDGFSFTAADESSIENATVTAAYKHDSNVASASITVKFGKGSEVLFDFEDGDISDWRGTDTIGEWLDALNAANSEKNPILKPGEYSNNIYTQSSSVFLASEENGGKVKNGQYALGLRLNHLNLKNVNSWVYNYLYYTGETQVLRDVANGKTAVRLGMWVYSPNITNVAFRLGRARTDADGTTKWGFSYMTSDYDSVKTSYATNYAIPEAGWIYVYYDLTDLADTLVQTTALYNPDTHNGVAANVDTYPAFLQLFSGSATDTMDDIIYYIDDITLDYSDVTDDRDAPVISNINVSTDGSNDVALNGQTVDSNLLSFSAAVSDASGNANATGLDYTTAKIYVDGIDASGNAGFKAANGMISLNNVYLSNGQHSIAFVIFDKQGNETRVTKSLTVNGSATNAVVSIAGHNDSNKTPEAGSVYYVDVKASDASQVEKITTTLKLNTANTFEYENIICGKGVTVETSYDALNFELTVTLTHDGSLSGEAVLASIPVRVWAWDEDATGITSAAQFETKAIPVINIECKVVKGDITYAGNDYASYITGFADELDVKTLLDNTSAWHVHSAAAMDDKAATCTETGYTGRTYCDGCASVVDWGKTVDATGHIYEITNGVLKCECGETFTGVWNDGKTYVDGVAQADGWVENSYYKDGVKLTGVHKVPADGSGEFYYDFGEDGVCKNGVKYTGLLQEENGKYYYAQVGVLKGDWNMIGEDWYYFNPETFEAASGSVKIGAITYDFEETGKLVSGVWANTLFGTRYYYGPGYHKSGWQTIDGKDYCFDDGYRLEDGWQLVLESQQYRNWYFFDENGVCEDKTQKPEDGIYTDRNGVAGCLEGIGLSGLHEIDGKYYYFNHHGYAQNNGTYAGRLFKDDYAAYTGFHEKNGVKCYYVNGNTATNGLYQVDGEYYVITWGGELKTNGRYYVSTTFCDLPAGTYAVDAEGKMRNGVVEMDGVSYLYINGQPGSNGLYKVGDDYYFSTWGGKLMTDGRYYVSTTFCDLPAGNYTVGEDGKVLDGVVEENGKLYLYVNGTTATKGLYNLDGAYYFSDWGGELKTDGRYYVSTTFCDLPAGNYTVGEDGKVLDGVVEENGKLYLYFNGTTSSKGLFNLDGAYYYSDWGGVLKTDGTYYVSATYCGDLSAGNYSFGADGKMLDGVVEIDGTKYLYINGKTTYNGIIKIGDDYYMCGWGGVLKTDGTYYVSADYSGDLPANNYTTDENGKLLNGFVTKDDGIYYYVNGRTPAPGLICVDGEFYYVYWGGKLITNQTFYVSITNGYTIPMNYTFDEFGRLVG